MVPNKSPVEDGLPSGMARLLRILLLIANAVLFVWLAYVIATVTSVFGPSPLWLGYGILFCLALNFVYLLVCV
jgi:hypothetical protein